MLNQVETIDKIIDFFKVQNDFGYESQNDSKFAGFLTGSCSYTTYDGRRCAIGCLMSAEEAQIVERKLGGSSIDSLYYEAMAVITGDRDDTPFLANIEEEDLPFLTMLQALHDNCSELLDVDIPEQYESAMEYFISKLEKLKVT